MNKEKLYPWIPIVGICLVVCNIDKDMGLENVWTFYTTVFIQAVSVVVPVFALHVLL